jgi:hypothetical protein
VLLIVIELASISYHFGWASSDLTLGVRVRKGALCVFYSDPSPPGFAYGGGGWLPDPPKHAWWFEHQHGRYPKWDPTWVFIPRIDHYVSDYSLWLPIAAPALLATGVACMMWRGWLRRPRPGKCASCRYDRSGLAPDAKCPECGAVPVK